MKAVAVAFIATGLWSGTALAQDTVTRTAPPVLTTPAPPPAVATGMRGEPLADVPLLSVATAAPTCGDIPLSAPVACVTAPLAAMQTVSEAYIDHYKGLGWLPADGDDNRIVMIKRRDGGGCDAMQMIAFYDTTVPAGPAVPGYLGFATIPGDLCADAPAPAPTPSTATPQ
ncbi:hypothetical protein BH10PSE1_BH10PSE1_33920 [soil metagenome]